MPSTLASPPAIRPLPCRDLHFSEDSLAIYGDPTGETDGLLESIRAEGVLVPLVVARVGTGWEVVSGHRRLACALALGLAEVPCEVRQFATRAAPPARDPRIQPPAAQDVQPDDARGRRPRRMAHAPRPGRRKHANLRPGRETATTRSSEFRRSGRSHRRGRRPGDRDRRQGPLPPGPRHLATGDGRRPPGPERRRPARRRDEDRIHAAYKDLRRRDRFTTGFRPTPYDVWSFKHDRAFGIPHPGVDPPRDRRPHPPLLLRPGRPGRRPDGRRRHDPRRLRLDGTPLPRVRHRPGASRNPASRRKERVSARRPRMRPHLLRSSLSHHAGAAVPPRGGRQRPA